MPLPVQRKSSSPGLQKASFLRTALRFENLKRTEDRKFCDYSDYSQLNSLNQITLPIDIVKTTPEHIAFWRQIVQPAIKKSHNDFLEKPPNGECRADAGWDWFWLNFMVGIFGGVGSCTYECYTIGLDLPDVQLGELELLPCCLLIAIWPREALSNRSSDQKAPLLWYITTAPKNALKNVLLGMGESDKSLPVNLFCWGLHSSIILSHKNGYGGKISLHASAGLCQKDLIFFYDSRIGMSKLFQDQPHPKSKWKCPPLYSKNDGGFFYMDADAANRFLQQMNAFVPG